MSNDFSIYDDNQIASKAAYAQLLEVWSESEKLAHASWISRCVNLFARVLASIWRAPLTALLSVLTLSTALFLFAIFLFCVEHVERILMSAQSEVTLSVYLRDDAAPELVEDFRQELLAFGDIRSVDFLSKNDALGVFRKDLGQNAGILDGIEAHNPLPASFELHFKEGRLSPERLNKLSRQLRGNAAVEELHYNQSFVDRLSGFLGAFRWGALSGSVLMLIMTAFIMWNTIRLALYAHRDELSVHRLLGATDMAITLPYVLEGSLIGLFSAVIALLFLSLGIELLPEILERAGEFKTFFPELHFLSNSGVLEVLCSGAGISLVSSFFAARGFIREQHEL